MKDVQLPRDPSRLTSEMKRGLEEREKMRVQIFTAIELIRLGMPVPMSKMETCHLIGLRCGLSGECVRLTSGLTRPGHRPRLSTYHKVLKALEEIRQEGGLNEKPIRRPLGISVAQFKGDHA